MKKQHIGIVASTVDIPRLIYLPPIEKHYHEKNFLRIDTCTKMETYCKRILQIFAQLQKASSNSVYFCYNTHFQKNVENYLHNKSLLYSEGGGRKILRDTAGRNNTVTDF